jgi:predicted amidohydrolase YtcJ
LRTGSVESRALPAPDQPAERISLVEAIEACTAGGASLLHDEHSLLEPATLAGLVVLGGNLFPPGIGVEGSSRAEPKIRQMVHTRTFE